MFEKILDFIFGPIVKLHPLLAIAIFSFIITLMTTLIYRAVTDQKKLKEIKSKLKDYQSKVKEMKDDPEEALKVQKKAMEKNMEYMQHSMKATLFTIIPIIIIFGWLNAHMGYYPIIPGQEFTVFAELNPEAQGMVNLDIMPANQIEFISSPSAEIAEGKAEWTLKGPEGNYILSYTHEGKTYEQELIITSDRKYAPPQKVIKQDNFISGNIVNEKIMPLKFIGLKWGWLGTYIIFSIVIGMSLRKVMGIS